MDHIGLTFQCQQITYDSFFMAIFSSSWLFSQSKGLYIFLPIYSLALGLKRTERKRKVQKKPTGPVYVGIYSKEYFGSKKFSVSQQIALARSVEKEINKNHNQLHLYKL